MAIKLKLLTKVFSIGLDELVDFLNTKGYYPPRNPQAQVPPEVVSLLHEKFRREGGEEKREKESPRTKFAKIEKSFGPKRFETPNDKAKERHKHDKRSEKSQPIKTTPESEKPIEIQKSDTIGLTIKAINRPNRIITEPFGAYEFGVLFPKDILFHGEAVSITLAEIFISQKLKVGYRINCKIVGSSHDGKTAFLTYELSDSAFKGVHRRQRKHARTPRR